MLLFFEICYNIVACTYVFHFAVEKVKILLNTVYVCGCVG